MNRVESKSSIAAFHLRGVQLGPTGAAGKDHSVRKKSLHSYKAPSTCAGLSSITIGSPSVSTGVLAVMKAPAESPASECAAECVAEVEKRVHPLPRLKIVAFDSGRNQRR